MKRVSALVGAGVVVFAVGLVSGGFLLGGHFTDVEHARLDPASTCGGQFGPAEAARFERIIPEARTLTVESETAGTVRDETWASRCTIASGEASVRVTSEVLAISASAWKDLMRSRGITTGGDLREIAIGSLGLTTPDATAVYIQCDNPAFEGHPVRLSVAAATRGATEASNGAKTRQDLAEIALKASQSAVQTTRCEPDEDSLLADHAPSVE